MGAKNRSASGLVSTVLKSEQWAPMVQACWATAVSEEAFASEVHEVREALVAAVSLDEVVAACLRGLRSLTSWCKCMRTSATMKLEQAIRCCILHTATIEEGEEDGDEETEAENRVESHVDTMRKLGELALLVATVFQSPDGSEDEELRQACTEIFEKANGLLDAARRLSAAVAMASRLAKAISNGTVDVPNIKAAVRAANKCKRLTLTGQAQREVTAAMVLALETVQENIMDPSKFDSNVDMCQLLVDFGVAMLDLLPGTDAGANSDTHERTLLAARLVQCYALNLLEALSQLKENPTEEMATRASGAFDNLKGLAAALPQAGAAYKACQPLIAKAQQVFDEQTSVAAGRLRTLTESIAAIGSWKAGLDTATATWDEVAARGNATLLGNATELGMLCRSLKQAALLIE
jgi:hypothetical protein